MTADRDAERVEVTVPRRGDRLTVRQGSVLHDIDEHTVLGDVYLRALARAQLRLALLVSGAVAVTLGGLPLLFAVVPSVRTVRVLGLGLPWLLLGIVAYPLMGAVAWFFVRQAEHTEREYTDLVERS
ncbi:MAG: hypothetical protein QOE54_2389 [Streptosporangiaceae bacterium]|jgi:hypothetical protein|nr:hypothetical protein [Streptosporangiaceae bacterium]MDX6430023.1 hypothetical protein [Streptosporangiaceae bacterium]